MFCGARPLTKTHLLALQFLPHFPAVDGYSTRRDWHDDGVAEPTERHIHRDGPALEVWVKRACWPCNGEWMAGIENQIAAPLIEMAWGEKGLLTRDGMLSLATWATIVAMLRGAAAADVTALDPRDPVFLRQNSSPPPGYRVWAVHTEADWGFVDRHSRLLVEGNKGHMTWFVVGQVGFVVADQHGSVKVLPLMDELTGAATPLFPLDDAGPGMAWPLKGEVTVEALRQIPEPPRFSGP